MGTDLGMVYPLKTLKSLNGRGSDFASDDSEFQREFITSHFYPGKVGLGMPHIVGP